MRHTLRYGGENHHFYGISRSNGTEEHIQAVQIGSLPAEIQFWAIENDDIRPLCELMDIIYENNWKLLYGYRRISER